MGGVAVGQPHIRLWAVTVNAMSSDHVCEVSDNLVNGCRVWLGARAAGYPGPGKGFTAQHRYHEKRIGRRLDMVHAFAGAGQLPFADAEVKAWARNEPSIVVHNWKPTYTWTGATGGHPGVDAHLTAAARAVAAVGRPVMVVVWHEPENDTGGQVGSAGDYVRMWANVRRRFADEGADNVTWGMAYMNYPKWDNKIAPLYPGDDAVDWLWFNAYGSAARPDPERNVYGFLDALERAGIAQNKPRGVIEWSVAGMSDKDSAVYISSAAAVAADTDLKAWMVFDSPGTHTQAGLRIAYDDAGRPAPKKAAAYREFAGGSVFACADAAER